MKYRADIDGLRAVAVMAVVLSHFGVPGFSGGYVGVDVFFVISGYLITRIITDRTANGSFSLLDFYEGRVRRIVPALLFVTLFLLIAGYALCSSVDYKNIGRATLAALAFSSNVLFFLSTADYFSTQFSPLLHTWSLGVEEQFYLFFPLLMILTARAGPRRQIAWALSITSALFLFSVYVTPVFPKAAFFLIFGRGWELGIGVLLALAALPLNVPRLARELVSFSGIAAIVASVVMLDETTPYPGVWAMLPVLGTAALVYASGLGVTVTGRLLSLPPVVALGLISYSLYLWHWPLVSLHRYITMQWELDLPATASLLLSSIALAWLTYRFVEQPFRQRSRIGRPALIASTGAGALVLVVFSGAVWATGGAPSRGSAAPPTLAATLQEAADFQANPCLVRGAELPDAADCTFGNADYSVVIWGDSEAAHLAPILNGLTKKDASFGWRQITRTGCAPLPSLTTVPTSMMLVSCPAFNAAAFKAILASKTAKVVIMAAAWYGFAAGSALLSVDGDLPSTAASVARFRHSVSDTVTKLNSAGVAVLLVGSFPLPDVDPAACIERSVIQSRDAQHCYVQASAGSLDMDAEVADILSGISGNVVLFRPTPHFCDADGCVYVEGNDIFFMDATHISASGGAKIASAFTAALEGLLDQR